jgi:hypothetical protein
MADLFSILEPVIVSGMETRKIELKREINLDDKPRAAKFAKILSALANTPGGTAYIVIGVIDRKDRTRDEPADYVIGFDPDKADEFNRQVQQALVNNLEPIPSVELHLLKYPQAEKTLGVLEIARSFNRPHRLKGDSDKEEPGVYLKRGGDTFSASLEEIEAMRSASQDSRLILNFGRGLTHAQMLQLKNLLENLPEVINLPDLPVQFQEQRTLAEQVMEVLDSTGLTLEEWSSLNFVVNLPGFAPAVAGVLAEIHGRSGHFPHVIRMTPSPDDKTVYNVTEIVKLQNIRDAARAHNKIK